MMVFSCAFILFTIVCCGISNFLSYLLLFVDCHICHIICVIAIVNFVMYLFVFGSVKVNRYFW